MSIYKNWIQCWFVFTCFCTYLDAQHVIHLPQQHFIQNTTSKNPKSRYSCIICMDGAQNRKFCDTTYSQKEMKGTSWILKSQCVYRKTNNIFVMDQKQAFNWCVSNHHCEASNIKQSPPSLDIRISKAIGSKGYGKLRISLIERGHPKIGKLNHLFSYSEPFRYRWKQFSVSTGTHSISTGKTNEFTLDGKTINLYIPKENQGTRGIVLADPCFSSRFVDCFFGTLFDTFNRTIEMLNMLLTDPSYRIDFFMILGDNFYDRSGEVTKYFFDHLTLEAKSKIIITVPGNHDYWILGNPILSSNKDQFANGYMQFYAQDTVASTGNNTFLNFKVDPDRSHFFKRLPNPNNFVTYHKIGNLGFFAFSNLYGFKAIKPYVEEACEYFSSNPPSLIFLLGHWNHRGDGVSSKASTPGIFRQLKQTEKCKSLSNKFKYITGHKHCNRVLDNGNGFLVGGQGMEGCGNFGLPILDSTNGRVEFLYYEFSHVMGFDHYNRIKACFQHYSPGKCKRHATVWLNQTLDRNA